MTEESIPEKRDRKKERVIFVMTVVEINHEEMMILDFLKEGYAVYVEQIREYLSEEKNFSRKSMYVEQIVRGLVAKNLVDKKEKSRGFVYSLKDKEWERRRIDELTSKMGARKGKCERSRQQGSDSQTA